MRAARALLATTFLAGISGIAYTVVAPHATAQSVPSGGSVSYTYDERGRLKTVTYDNGAKINYTYDAAGNRTRQTITLQ